MAVFALCSGKKLVRLSFSLRLACMACRRLWLPHLQRSNRAQTEGEELVSEYVESELTQREFCERKNPQSAID